MKELYAEGVVNHSDPEAWGQRRRVLVQALTGESMGADIKPRKYVPEADPVPVAGRPCMQRRSDESLHDPAGSMNRRTSRTSGHENREIQQVSEGGAPSGRTVQGTPRTTVMNACWKSDEGVVPMNRRRPSGRGVGEGRPETSGNPDQPTMAETQDSEPMLSGLERVRQAARRNTTMRFTNLMHHVTPGKLDDAYRSLKRTAAAGVDGVTWEEYGEQLAERLTDLHRRVHDGRYRALPSKPWSQRGHTTVNQLSPFACFHDAHPLFRSHAPRSAGIWYVVSRCVRGTRWCVPFAPPLLQPFAPTAASSSVAETISVHAAGEEPPPVLLETDPGQILARAQGAHLAGEALSIPG